MESSFMSVLPGVHATILSIIVAFSTIFLLNAYQTILETQQKLNSCRKQVRSMMSLWFYSSKNSDIYIQDGKITNKAMQDFVGISSMYMDTDQINNILDPKIGFTYENRTYTRHEIAASVNNLIGLMTAISMSYPYNGAKAGEKDSYTFQLEYDKMWFEELNRMNQFYLSFFKGKFYGLFGLIKLAEEYRVICRQTMSELIDKGWLHRIDRGQVPAVQITKEGEEFAGEINASVDIDYSAMIRDFANRLDNINNISIPTIAELDAKLEFNKDKFKIKTHSIRIVLISIFILLFGVLIPIFLNIFGKPPYIKSIETFLLVSTMLPYFYGLFYLLKHIAGLKIP